MNGLFLNEALILGENTAAKLDLADLSEIEYVVDGAELICDGCPGEKTNLQVTSQNDYEIKNKLVATKKDKETFENIPPFQSCIYNDNAKCEVIVEGDWENYIEDKFCGANQCLSKNSFARCQKGGIIRVIHSGQFLTSETIAKDSEELMKIASQGGTKEETKKKLSEYLSKKYNQPMNVEDFKFTNGKFPTLDITTRGQMQNDFNKIELNRNLQTDVNEFNKNGIFFTERKTIQKVELLGNEYRVRETKDKDFPVRGVIYTDSNNYREKRGISKEIIEKTKKDWANEAKKRGEKKQNSHNNIQWVKSIKEFDKKSDKWFDDLNVKIVDYKKNKDGSVTLVVDDFGNFLNKRENQRTIKEYEKNGIKFKNSIVGSYMSTEHAMQQYTIKQQYIRGFNYDDEYIDGKNIKSMYETYVGFSAAYGAMKSYRVMSGNKSKRKMSNGKTSELDIETRYKNTRARYEESMNCDLYCRGTRCFAEGTFVLTEYGIKKIEEIKAGDKIYGYDEVKKENILKSVQAVYLHTTDLLVKIKTKKDIIFTTPEHPFYVNGQYILAGFLNTNMKLTDFEGKEVEIKEIEIIKYQKEQKVYNFSVEGTRNYYVGEERLLNHNLDDCTGGTGILLDDETKINDNKRKIENELGKNIEDFRLDEGNQGKHDPNHKNYQSEKHKSEVSMDDAKNIFKKFKATGNFVQDPRSGNFYEIIDTQGEYQGIYINNRRNERLITTKFKIHYSKKGLVHVVPEHPNKK
jgi:hedgehog/intein hint domain protein